MKNCPICYHPLPEMVAGKRQICSFCGWVNQSHQSKGKKAPLKHYTALSPEEIARQQIQNAESPVLSLVLTGLGLLVITFLSIQGLRHSQPPPRLWPKPFPLNPPLCPPLWPCQHRCQNPVFLLHKKPVHLRPQPQAQNQLQQADRSPAALQPHRPLNQS